jgi:NADPH-dependent curcumin reductase CurA
MGITLARVTGGNLHEHLKNIDIVGRIDDCGDFIVFGCKKEDEERFYKAILEYDKKVNVQGFETVEQVREWWEEEADMQMYIDKGDFEMVHSQGILK